MNNKKYNLFDFTMYKNALKRMRVQGILYVAITIFISVIIPIGRYIAIKTYGADTITVSTTPILATFSYMMLTYILCSPAIILSYFSFLNKRNASDYYHMFPQKRGCIFNTIFAAAVTWIVFILLSCFVSTAVAYTIFGKYLTVSLPALLKFLLCIFAASMLVCGATTLACTLTGTIFTNIIVTGIILFLPRFILTIAMYMITVTHDIFVHNAFFPLLDNRYNLVVSTFTGIVTEGYGKFIEFPNIIYTLVLAIIYIIAAHILFVLRKSETAGSASAGHKTQCIIRVCIGMPLSMLPISYLFSLITATEYNKPEFNAVTIFSGFIIYSVILIMMLVYELLSTRKLKNVVRAIPSFGILGFANAGLLLLMIIMFYTQLSYNPSPSELDYIKTGSFSDAGYNDYFEKQIADYPVNDPEAFDIVCKALDNTIEYEKGNVRINREKYKPINIIIKTGLTEKHRNIYMHESDIAKLSNILSNTNNVKDIYMNLPEFNSNTMSASLCNVNNHDVADNEDLYTSLREEVALADYDKWREAVQNAEDSDCFYLFFEESDEYGTAYTYLPITPLTPKTFIKTLNYCNRDAGKKNLENVKAVVEKCKTEEDLKACKDIPNSFYLCVSAYNNDLETISEEKALYNYDADALESIDYEISEKEFLQVTGQEEALATIQAALDEYGTEITSLDNPGKTLYRISYSAYYYDNSDSKDYCGTYFIWR